MKLSYPFLFSTLALTSGFALAGNPPAPVAKTPILFFDFDKMTSGTPAHSVSTGSSPLKAINVSPKDPADSDRRPKKYKSKSGEGVSGQNGDYSLDFTNATLMGKEGTGGAAFVEGAAGALAGLKSFTLCGWYKVEYSIGNASRLMEMYNQETQGFFLAGDDDGNLALEVNKRRVLSNGLDFKATDVWVFFAAVYNGTLPKDNVTFYTGTAAKGLSSVTVNTIVEKPLPQDGGALAIGNSAGFQRPTKGFMDNVAIYGSSTDASGALSEAEIKTVFHSVADKMRK